MKRPLLLCLPGNMCDSRLWSLIENVFPWPAADGDLSRGMTIDEMASSLLATHEGPLLPVGFSMGGIVAIEMARQAPDRVKGLVLIDTNAGADLPARAAARPLQQARVRAGELDVIVADELKPAYLATANRDDCRLKSLLFDMAMELGNDVFIAQSEALRLRADNWPVLDDFKGPILFLCGAEDALCPPALHQAMAARSAKSTLHIIAGAGHMLPLEAPRAFSTALGDWLNVQTEALTQ